MKLEDKVIKYYCLMDRHRIIELRGGMKTSDLKILLKALAGRVDAKAIHILALMLDHNNCSRQMVQKIYAQLIDVIWELKTAADIFLLRPELKAEQIDRLLSWYWDSHMHSHAIGTLLRKVKSEKCRASRLLLTKLLAPDCLARLARWNQKSVREWAKANKLSLPARGKKPPRKATRSKAGK